MVACAGVSLGILEVLPRLDTVRRRRRPACKEPARRAKLGNNWVALRVLTLLVQCSLVCFQRRCLSNTAN